ncbi:restriction endonuclease [Methylobacterium mesophilicum]|uniref:restriction endonuclease n=1 Tax=Methylobacterium mesophilicum TaxID=39956 RepID=UPI002F324A3D
MFATSLALWVAAILFLLAWLHFQERATERCRRTIRPQVERLIIENRWMERHARNAAAFEALWDREVARMHRAHLARPLRALVGFRSFKRVVRAEFASILPAEIASWTFVDHAIASQPQYEALMLRCLKAAGWRLDYQDQEHFVLLRARTRVVVRLHWADRDVACLPISDVAAAAERAGSATACVMTNGRFSGAARALAEEQNVLALHCSQIDLLLPRDKAAVASRGARGHGLRLAA